MFKTCKKPPMSIISASGSICTFNALQEGIPLKSCVSQISGYQEGSGTPSPDNVRPLHAFLSGTLNKTGKNLVNININTSQYSGTYNFGKVLYGTFTLSAKKNDVVLSETVWIVRIDYADGTYDYCGDEGYSNPFPCVINATSKGIKSITYRSYGITSGSYDLMFELGDIASPYEPFGNTYTFTFGQSIYQGSIDWKRGVVVGTHSIVDLGSLNWARNTQYINPIFLANIPEAKVALDSGFKPNAICSQYEVLAPNRTNVAGVNYVMTIDYYYNSSYNTTIIDTDYTDPTAFKTAMNGVQLAYELATPIEIQLSGIQIENILGDNNIFADCGSTSIEAFKFGR